MTPVHPHGTRNVRTSTSAEEGTAYYRDGEDHDDWEEDEEDEVDRNGDVMLPMEEEDTALMSRTSSSWASIIRDHDHNNNKNDTPMTNQIRTFLPPRPPQPSAPSESDLWRASLEEEPIGAWRRDVGSSVWLKDAADILPPPPPPLVTEAPPQRTLVPPPPVATTPVLYDYQKDWIVYTTATAGTTGVAPTTSVAGGASNADRPPDEEDDDDVDDLTRDARRRRSPASAELEQRFDYIDSLLNDHLASVSPVRRRRKESVPVVGIPVYPPARPVLPGQREQQQYKQRSVVPQEQQQIVTIRIPREPSSTTLDALNRDSHEISTSFLSTAPGDTNKTRYGSLEEMQGYSTIWASGIAGAVVGTLVLGTIPGVIAGFYAAYVHGDEGAAGDISRAMGEVAIVIRHKALMIEARHHIIDKTQWVLEQAFLIAVELNRRHEILKKVKKFVQFSWTMTLDYLGNKGREIQWDSDQRSRTRQPIPTNTLTIVPPEHHNRRIAGGARWRD